MREQGSGTRSAFEEILATVGVDSSGLDVAFTLPANEAVRAAITAGPYVTVLSTLVVAAEVGAGLLCIANIILPPRAVYLVRQPSRYRSRASMALEQLIGLDGDGGAGRVIRDPATPGTSGKAQQKIV